MHKAEPAAFCWSGGKDSALALAAVRERTDLVLAGLITTLTEGHDRISMHGVRRTLLHAQARALDLPLHEVWIPTSASNAIYEERMSATLRRLQSEGVTTIVFGDIFLEDLRAYRERQLAGVGLRAAFPLWKRDTRALIDEFVSRGFRAVLTCIDTSVLPEAFAGRTIDERFTADLPPGVDPCGENGEYHTFVYQGPIFRRPIPVSLGETRRDGQFLFRDLQPNV